MRIHHWVLASSPLQKAVSFAELMNGGERANYRKRKQYSECFKIYVNYASIGRKDTDMHMDAVTQEAREVIFPWNCSYRKLCTT